MTEKKMQENNKYKECLASVLWMENCFSRKISMRSNVFIAFTLTLTLTIGARGKDVTSQGRKISYKMNHTVWIDIFIVIDVVRSICPHSNEIKREKNHVFFFKMTIYFSAQSPSLAVHLTQGFSLNKINRTLHDENFISKCI